MREYLSQSDPELRQLIASTVLNQPAYRANQDYLVRVARLAELYGTQQIRLLHCLSTAASTSALDDAIEFFTANAAPRKAPEHSKRKDESFRPRPHDLERALNEWERRHSLR